MRLLALLAPLLLAASAPAPVKPALWLVADEDTRIYLFGTVHLLPPGVAWFEGPVAQAFGEAGELVVEVVSPPPAEAQATIARLATATDGKTLRARLPADLARRLETEMGALGVPRAAFDAYEPWYAGVVLALLEYRKLGLDPAQGVETALTAGAAKAGKRVEGLEGFAEQLGFLDTLPEAEQVRFLAVGVDELGEAESDMIGMLDAWRGGQPERLAALMNESLADAPALRRRLLDERNARWADWVKARMDRPGTVFMAVGAGHLAGPASVQAMLAKRGVTVRRVR